MKLMKPSKVVLLKSIILFLFLQPNSMMGQSQKKNIIEHEIKEALRLETQYFYKRDVAKWEGQWSHGSFVMKCYVRNGKYTEQLGWPIIQQSAKDYMKAHPKPEKAPTDIPEYEIEVFEKSAFVSYVQMDPTSGIRKREIRLLVKEEGKWRIGFMNTNYFEE